MAILQKNLHSFFLFSKLKPTMLQNRALQYCTGLHFRHSSFGGRCDSFVDLNFTKMRVSCVSFSDYPKVIRLESRLSRVDEPQLGTGVLALARSLGVLGNGMLPSSGPYRGAISKRLFCHVTGKDGNFGSKDDRRGVKNSSFNVFNKHKKRAKGNQITGYSSSNSRIAASEDADVVTSSNHIVEEVGKDVNVSTSKSKPKQQSGSRRRQKKSTDATATATTNAEVQPKVSKSTTKKKNTKVAQSDQVPLESESAAVQPKVSKTVSKKMKAKVAQSDQIPLEPEKSLTDAMTEELLDSSVPTTQQTKTKTRRKAKPKSKVVPSARAEAPSVSSAIDLPQKQTSQTSVKPKPHKQRVIKQLYPPTGKSVLVVESVTKAKVIQGYLGDMFEVIPSYGHVRDLAARSGSVRPDEDFSMVWEVPSAAWTHLKSIKVALSGAKNLILASDPDREGEAIAWHIVEMLEQQDALGDDINLARVVFNEITEASIKTALLAPRDIDANLVNSYLARRALDYLIGFNISPVLWRKLPGCRSAGRVQSAALSLICDREMEIDGFKPQEYWTLDVLFRESGSSSPVDSNSISSYLTHFQSKKLSKLSIDSQTKAIDIQGEIEASEFEVSNSKRSKMRKNPPAPYITSSLQQDAANKLSFPATYTMKLAQKLYEGVQLPDGVSAGLITYIRTDGLHISDEACKDICSLVRERYGESFASDGARKYFKKVKNAQEAHEAIRPTNIRRVPSSLAGVLDEDSLKLYTLIWSRTLACQMEPAIYDQIQVDIGNADRSIIFRSSCSRTEFLGYQAAFEDVETRAIRNRDNEVNDRSDVSDVLSNLKAGDPLYLGKVEPKQHHTQPPPRFSEGSLVKTLEELGIGRPSTYASTMKVLQDRNYITVKSRILYPEFRGRMLSAFLSNHFSEVTDYSFTADMETELDNVSAGLTEWKGLLGDYWTRFSKYCESTSNVHIHEVEKMLEKTFGDFIFTSLPNKSRTCPSCREGTLVFKVSRFGVGYFIGCDQHPRCKYIAKTIHGDDDDDEGTPENHNLEEPKVLGVKPGSDEKILLKNGPYGYYVQLGVDRKGYLPKRASVSQVKDTSSITLEDALEMLRYPVTLVVYVGFDDVLNEIFQLIVLALGMLSSEATRGYSKALHILENISKVRACLLMLDLECDQLIADMFELFLSTIRYIHLPVVFRHMEYIMTLVIEESEEISEELLNILLSSVSKKNTDQSVFSRPWRLGEKVLRNCAVELQRFLPKVAKLRNLNLDDFSDIVASICQNSPEDEHEVAEVADPSSVLQSKIIMNDGFGPEKTNGILRGTNSLKTLEPGNTQAGRHSQTENSDVTGILQAKAVTVPKKRGRKPNSQHGHTDGSQPTKLLRKKDSTVVNRCHEVTKTDTRTNHASANIVVKKESDDSEQYFEQVSRKPHAINEKLVGRRVKVWWPLDKMFYEGAVASFDSLTQMHKVLYADGDEETLNLRKERWELLEEQHTPAASNKSPKKKKAKTTSASSTKPGTISSAKGPKIADKSKTEAPKSGICADNFAPYDVTKDDVNKADFTRKDEKQKSTSEADVSKPDALRIADMATNGITVNPNPTDDKQKLISKKETKTPMTTTKPKFCTVVELGGESATHTTFPVKDKSSLSEEMLPDTVNAQGSDSSGAKKRRRLVNGEGVAP